MTVRLSTIHYILQVSLLASPTYSLAAQPPRSQVPLTSQQLAWQKDIQNFQYSLQGPEQQGATDASFIEEGTSLLEDGSSSAPMQAAPAAPMQEPSSLQDLAPPSETSLDAQGVQRRGLDSAGPQNNGRGNSGTVVDSSPPAGSGFLRSSLQVDDSQGAPSSQMSIEDQELLAKAALLEKEASKIRQDLQHELHPTATLHPEVSGTTQKNVHSYEAPVSAQPGSFLNGLNAAETALADDITTYSYIGLGISLGVQFLLICCVGTFICTSNIMNFGDLGPGPIFFAFCFFASADAIWTYVILTGVMDKFIEEFLCAVLVAALLLGHIGVLSYLFHTWAHKHAAHLYRGSKFDKCATAVMTIEHKLELVMKNLKIQVPKILHIDNQYDSETEDCEPPPPGDHEKRVPLRITMVKGKNLPDADGGWLKNDVSDPYCTCAVRGRKSACWEASRARLNNSNPEWDHQFHVEDFRVGDTLKFKCWDSDVGASSQLLGRVSVNYEQVTRAMGHGQQVELPLLVPPDLDAGAKKATLFVIIEKYTVGMEMHASLSEFADRFNNPKKSVARCC